jgi:septum formation protein
MKIVLASASPQRRALLEALGVEFEAVDPDVEESRRGEPSELVVGNARRKAEAASAGAAEGTLVIAGDTEVVLDGEVLGQPADAREALGYLRALSGRHHEVFGGIVLLSIGERRGRPRERHGVEVSRVRFKEIEPPLMEIYLASGEWRGRAGAYAVQGLGSALVAAIEGDVSNVVGLPIGLLAELAPELLARR